MGNTEIEGIEKDVKRAKEIAQFGAAVERLRSNADFRKVVLDGYFEREAVRLVHLKADPSMDSPEKQASIVAQMDAIGGFSAFLTNALRMGETASKQVVEGEEALEALHAEQASEGGN